MAGPSVVVIWLACPPEFAKERQRVRLKSQPISRLCRRKDENAMDVAFAEGLEENRW